MAVSCAVLTEGASDTDATSYTSASVTFTSGKAYVIAYLGRRNGGSPTTPTVTGGPTWTASTNLQFGTIASPVCRMRLYRAYGDGSTSALTFDHGATTMSGACWIVLELSGVDVTTIAVQAPSANGDASTTASVTLAAFGSAANATIGFIGIKGTTSITAGTGFTAFGNQSNATDIIRLRTEFRSDNDTSVDATIGASSDFGIIGIEIKAAVAGAWANKLKRTSLTTSLLTGL